jgi:hypothetical protein
VGKEGGESKREREGKKRNISGEVEEKENKLGTKKGGKRVNERDKCKREEKYVMLKETLL